MDGLKQHIRVGILGTVKNGGSRSLKVFKSQHLDMGKKVHSSSAVMQGGPR